MTEYDLGKVVGDDGEAGNGIASITKTGTSGLVDTYTITYDDGTTTTFTVTNGSDASVTIQTSWGSTTSDSKVPSEKLTKDTLDTKIAKSSTTGLVKNDGTIMTSGTGSTNYSAGNHSHSGYVSATKVTSWSGTVSDSNVPSEKLVKNSLDDKIGKSSTSGLVKNDGTIDTNSYLTSSSLSNYVQKSSTSGLLKNDGTVDTNSYITSSSLPTKTSDLTNDGDGTNAFVKTNDSRLSDARTPVSHTHTKSQITDFPTLSTVATSGSYNDLSNKPSIPSSSSDLSDGSSLVKTSSTTGLLKNDGTVMTSGTGSSNWAVGNHTHSAYVNPTIADNLTTNDSSQVLSAKQGKVLNDLIGAAITYINQ